jgi:hypothetical protein
MDASENTFKKPVALPHTVHELEFSGAPVVASERIVVAAAPVTGFVIKGKLMFDPPGAFPLSVQPVMEAAMARVAMSVRI